MLLFNLGAQDRFLDRKKMFSVWDEIKEKISTLTGGWASYAALGTFALYLFGYLSLRFHLTALGIPTDLSVVDSRYLYAGAKFVVYIALYIPLVVLFAIALIIVVSLPALVLAGLIALYKRRRRSLEALAGDAETKKENVWCTIWSTIKAWSEKPWLVAVFGILISEFWIQVLMRQCLDISDALLNPAVINRSWIGAIMKHGSYPGNLREVVFFSALVAGTSVVGWLLIRAWRWRKKIARARMLKAQEMNDLGTCFLLVLLAVLFTIQVLLLPVNHGVLIADKVLPRVKDLGGQEKLQNKQTAWLVWEGTDGVTYLVQGEGPNDAGENKGTKVRTLVTLPKKDVKRTEVIANDPIENLLNETGIAPP